MSTNISSTDNRFIVLSPKDNVFLLRESLAKGETLLLAGKTIQLSRAIAVGHKLAACPINKGEKIVKYGAPIGSATAHIAIGEHVHLHNMKSDYTQSYALTEPGTGQAYE